MVGNVFGYSKSQIVTMEVLLCIGTSLYLALLALDGYNLFWFLYKQGRSKILFIKSFYALTTLIILLRISEFSIMLVIFFSAHDETVSTTEVWVVFAEALDAVASYLTICVGLF